MRHLPPGLAIALAAVSVATGSCGDPAPTVGRDAAPRALSGTREPAATPADPPAVPASESRPPAPPPPRIRWPSGWRLLDSGSFGREGDAVAWYRLEASSLPAGQAASEALQALRPVTGATEVEHLSSPSATPGRAVGQIRGSLFRGAVDARSGPNATSVLVLLESHPG